MSRCAGTLAGCLWAVALLATSCTEVDNTVGGSLIPQQQQIQLAYTTTGGINAYLTLVDSLPAVYSPYGYIGNTSSPTFGQTLCSWVAQYAPYGFNTTAVTFGKAPVVDSLVLQLTIDESAAFGDATVPQTFHVYELTRRFYLDSIYTTPMDLVGAFSSEPVGTLPIRGAPRSAPA